MPTLTSLLARDGVVSLDVIEQALQRQVLEGGELDTALLELGAIKDEDLLARYRADSYDLVPALRAQLDDLETELCEAFPAELARGYQLVPLAKSSAGLVLASAWPLSSDAQQAIADRTGGQVELRIGTELRVLAALERHYGVSLGMRLSRLIERLGGPLRLSEPPPPRVTRTSTESSAGIGTAPALRGGAASAEPDVLREVPMGPPVRVTHTVKLGTVRSLPSAAVSATEVVSTRASRPSLRAPGGKLSRSPRGPLTRLRAMDLLEQADDRDRVLDAFFSFARQYFSCTVLFALRDEHLLGLEASGLASDMVRSLEVEVPSTGTVHAVVLGRTARIVDLSATPADLPLVEALGRVGAQPAALLPIAIRRRIVAVLYGDRAGEPMAINELWELLHTLPAVSGAFERIIKLHKLQAVQARRAMGREARAGAKRIPTLGGAKPSAGAFGRNKVNTASGLAGRPSVAPSRPPESATPQAEDTSGQSDTEPSFPAVGTLAQSASAEPPEAATEAVPEAATEAATEAMPAAATEAALEAATEAAPDTEHQPPTALPLSTQPGIYRFARRRENDITRPGRPSNLPARRQSLTPGTQEAPANRTLSQPPPGAGSYALSSGAERVAEETQPAEITRADVNPSPAVLPAASAKPSTRPATLHGAGPARESLTHSPASAAARDLRRETTPRRPLRRTDPRADGSTPAPGEVVSIPNAVSIPDAVRESLRSPLDGAEHGTPIVVNLASEAQRLLDDLMRAGPDDEKPMVDALVRLGEAALPPLQQRFPGPLWFDRHKPRQRMPAGRDLSAAARALYAFGDAALPYVAELLSANAAETRLCATLFAADVVRPALLWPLYQRLFDPDGQVRLVATETLPLYRNVEGFGEVLKSLRGRAADEREAVAGRLSAIEAIFGLRDPGSVELLGTLCGHRNRQFSVPAHRALVAITGNDFGDSERRWRGWAEKNRGRHRIEWLIEGLMHGDERVRTTAGLELQKLTQVYYGFDPGAGKREREQAQTRYRNWWMIDGRRQFTG